jgi:hypothetical protein
MRTEERILQKELMLRFDAEKWPVLAFPIPNGLWIPAHNEAEKRIVARIIARMKADGMLVPGAPDIALFWRGGSALVELKKPASKDIFGRRSPAGRPTQEQRNVCAKAAELDVHHLYCHGWDEMRAAMERWGIER